MKATSSLPRLLWLVLLWVAVVVVTAGAEEDGHITQQFEAEITSCKDCRLSQWKALETFLLDGEAESYQGVSVLFISDGRDPTMVLTDQEDNHHRTIQLKDYKTRAELVTLFEHDLGFTKRTDEQVQKYRRGQRRLQSETDRLIGDRAMEELKKLKQKKDEIAEQVLKMQEKNWKKAEERRLKAERNQNL